MLEPISISTTFEVITEKSAEYGEPEETGFLEQNESMDFDSMVRLLEDTEPSRWPIPGSPSKHLWFTEYGSQDDNCFLYRGEIENNSFHADNERTARYMLKAWKIANKGNR